MAMWRKDKVLEEKIVELTRRIGSLEDLCLDGPIKDEQPQEVQSPGLAIYCYRAPETSEILYVPSNAIKARHTIIDEDTALWAARMCVGEGGKKCSEDKAAAMLWALMYRWFLHPAAHKWPSYRYLMRRFSQPINPRWQRGGDLAIKYVGTQYSTPAKLRRRAKISALTWKRIPKQIVRVVRDFQAGMCPPPAALDNIKRARITNWASHKGLAARYPWGISFETSKQPDWFFEDKALRPGSVKITPATRFVQNFEGGRAVSATRFVQNFEDGEE